MKYQDEFIGPFLSEAVEASISYFFLKLVDETQMPKPPEATRHHNPRKLLTPSPFVSKWDTLYIQLTILSCQKAIMNMHYVKKMSYYVTTTM